MTILLAPDIRRAPAQMKISGSLPNGADWVQTLIIVDQDGEQVTGVGSDDWVIQFRDDQDDTAADLTLSTDDELTITVGATTTLAVDADASTMSALTPGSYIVDIASETSGGVKTHRGHGRVTIVGAPASF
jgi:hypothetical protein